MSDNIKQHLGKYVDNLKQAVSGCDYMIEVHTKEEQYEQAREIQILKQQHEISILKLERILQGLPVFEEQQPEIIKENNNDKATN